MNTKNRQKQKSRRLFWLFLCLILLIFGGGSAFWYYASDKMDQTITGYFARMQQQGRSAVCTNQTIKGFPFRLGLFCDRFAYDDPNSGVSLKVGAVRSAAQFYAPGKLVAELDGPLELVAPDRSRSVASWNSLRSSVQANLDGLESLSVVTNELALESDHPALQTLSAITFELHARKSGTNDLETAIGLIDLEVVTPNAAQIQPITMTVELTAKDLFDTVTTGRNLKNHIRTNGFAGTLTALNLQPKSGGKLLLSGPIRISKSGLLSTELRVEFEQLRQLFSHFRSAIPQLEDQASQIETALSALTTSQNDAPQTVIVSISQGNMRLGLIPLGSIPPLF